MNGYRNQQGLQPDRCNTAGDATKELRKYAKKNFFRIWPFPLMLMNDAMMGIVHHRKEGAHQQDRNYGISTQRIEEDEEWSTKYYFFNDGWKNHKGIEASEIPASAHLLVIFDVYRHFISGAIFPKDRKRERN